MNVATPADRYWALGLLVPVLLAGLFSLSRLALEGFDVPSDEDYREAAAVVESWGFRKGEDAVAVLPPWSLRAHVALKGFEPVSGDDLHTRPLDRYARLFIVVEPDAGRYRKPLEKRLGAPAAKERRGRVEVLRFDLGEPRVVYDFAAELKRAEIVITKGDATVMRCERPTRRGVSCQGGKGWQRVTREHLLVTENSQYAVWAHPPSEGEALELTWRDVPLDDELVFSAGHTRTGADSARAAVDVEILVGGEVLTTLRYPPRFAFETTRVSTSRFKGQRKDVSFRVSTADNATNHWAFDAFVARGGAP